MCTPTLLRPQPSELVSTADTITITVKIREERGWALGGERIVSFEIPVKAIIWGYIVLGMWFKKRNQYDRKGIDRRLFLCYNSWLLSEVLYNTLNFICNCSDLLHLSKTCDSYFLDTESFSKVVWGFFSSCATIKSVQRASLGFHLSTVEKHILWQRNCLLKGKEEINILISSSEGKNMDITGRDTETTICVVPSGLITSLMF